MKKGGAFFNDFNSVDTNNGLYVSKKDILTPNIDIKEYSPLNIDRINNMYSSFGGKKKTYLKKHIQSNIDKLYINYINKKKSDIKAFFQKKGGFTADTNNYKGLYVSEKDVTNINTLNYHNNFVEKPVIYDRNTPQSSFVFSA
jgi:hypothetical protein